MPTRGATRAWLCISGAERGPRAWETRHGFIRNSIVAFACALLLAGCTQVRSGSGGRNPWTKAGVLRLGDVADPDSLNPLLSTMDLSYDLSSLAFSYLVITDDRGKLIGDLTSQVPSVANGGISRDGRRYVYHLRGGVRWQDGAALTAHDVAFTWRAVMSPRNNVLHREGYQEVERIDTPDARTVVVRLKRRYPPFVTQFFTTLQEGAKPILPAHLLSELPEINDAAYNALPIGSGPSASSPGTAANASF